MKKKNIILDFTSLLDIIMILLFVVMFNSQQNVAAELSDNKKEIDQLANENSELKQQVEFIENDAIANIEVYESVIDNMSKVNLICTTEINPETGNPEVIIDIVVNSKEGQEESLDTFVITHELELTSSERKILTANQTSELSDKLFNILEHDESPMFWFMMHYDYLDENLTYSDLTIVNDSIKNVETLLSKPCYLEELNISKEK